MTSIGLRCGQSGLELAVSWAEHAPATLTLRLPGQAGRAAARQPLVEAQLAGEGRDWAGRRLVTTAVGSRLRHRRHRIERAGPWQSLKFTQYDETTGLEFMSVLSVHDDQLGVRSSTTVLNTGSGPQTLHAVSSLVFADFGWEGPESIDALWLVRGQSDWLAEGRWTEVPLRAAGLPALTYPQRPFRSRGCIEAVSRSSWSTAYELPVAVLTDHQLDLRWTFQIEHNGGWLWQIGELADGLYLALTGPTDEHHAWQRELAPGDSFESVPATLTVEPAGHELSLAALTGFRRASLAGARRPALPVIFNDYMNTVSGDPSSAVLRPLVAAAAAAGADYFVIDAGWYADDGDWWDTVGEWQPSDRRFPEGLDDLLAHIRSLGMVPGLWLEPEVVGVNSPTALKLPDSAFLQRDGVRVVEHGRYHLDFTADETIDWLDEVVDRLVNELGTGYFKFDYNIRAGVGSDAHTTSAGDGLLRHNRAYLRWVDALRARHPQVVLENCASGGMRQDFATVSRFDLQSTSDQEDVFAYAPIAAAAPMLVLPEQLANWGYPQPEMSDDQIVFTLATALAGRIYLSGWLDRLSPHQSALVAAAVTAHKEFADRLPASHPFWPIGLPGWQDEWIVAGLSTTDAEGRAEVRITCWRRSDQPGDLGIPLPPPPAGHHWHKVTDVFPPQSSLGVTLTADGTALHVVDDIGRRTARVVSLTSREDD